MRSSPEDRWLRRRLERYDRWLAEGRIPTSSKVIPVRRSLDAQQWILPTEQVLELLRNARSFALAECSCRSRYGRCDNPREVCFLLNDEADRHVARGEAQPVDLAEAERRAELADEHGLVHLTIYNPDQHVYAVCSCCSCCCHDLQFMTRYGRGDLIARSDYTAATDWEACVHCGACVERCVFGARVWEQGEVSEVPDRCRGCGLCVSSCPAEAVRMVLRRQTD